MSKKPSDDVQKSSDATLSHALSLSLRPDHIRRHPKISKDVQKTSDDVPKSSDATSFYVPYTVTKPETQSYPKTLKDFGGCLRKLLMMSRRVLMQNHTSTWDYRIKDTRTLLGMSQRFLMISRTLSFALDTELWPETDHIRRHPNTSDDVSEFFRRRPEEF